MWFLAHELANKPLQVIVNGTQVGTFQGPGEDSTTVRVSLYTGKAYRTDDVHIRHVQLFRPKHKKDNVIFVSGDHIGKSGVVKRIGDSREPSWSIKMPDSSELLASIHELGFCRKNRLA